MPEYILDDKDVNTPPDYSKGSVAKSFDEAQHPRDEYGKFADASTDIGHDTPETHMMPPLHSFDEVKQHLSSGTKVILSAEKSTLSPSENHARSVGLKRILNNYSSDVTMQEGQWGGTTERSYVATVKPEDLPAISDLAFSPNELNQEAMVVIKDGNAEMHYADGRKSTGVLPIYPTRLKRLTIIPKSGIPNIASNLKIGKLVNL